MLDQDVMGIILPDRAGATAGSFTTVRSVSALPFAGRYRLIDFTMSNMVHANINTVAVLPVFDYVSLMEHLGGGKPWDLNRKTHGFSLLPPRISLLDLGEVDILYNHLSYIQRAKENYVVLSYGNVIYNHSLKQFIEFHKKTKAEVSMMYHRNPIANLEKGIIRIPVDEKGRIQELIAGADESSDNVFTGVSIFEKSFFVNMLEYCFSRNLKDISLDYIQRQIASISAYGFEATGYFGMVNDVASYYNNNMKMLRLEQRNELFASGDPIYTRVMDSVPTKYGCNSKVHNALVADGCNIQGTVEDSIIFRGVHIEKSAHIVKSIIMPNATIGAGCYLEHAILDRDVTLSSGRTLVGDKNYPIMVRKGVTI